MRREAIVACVALGVGTVGMTGCSSPVEPPPPAFNPGTPEVKNLSVAYPAGPYGVGEGSTIEDLQFIGYVNAVANTKTMQVIGLGDFYNPHGTDATYKPASAAEDDRLFPPSSQYGEGKKKPTVLAFDMASVWCAPCNLESRCVTPVHQHRYEPCGGGFMLQLQDGATPGVAATPKNLFSWAASLYKENFPVAIDPSGRIINAYAEQQAFPQNYIIDTKTMKIMAKVAGIPDAAFWATYESLLADPSCPAKQSTCQSDADCAAFAGTSCSTTCPANAFTCIPNACQVPGCTQ